MDQLFRIVRFPLVPIPLIAWTAIWPITYLIQLIIILPVWFFLITILRILGFPFIFLNAAFNNDKDSISGYINKWRKEYGEVIKFATSLPVGETYNSIFLWLSDPKSNGGTGAIIASNIGSVIVVASIYSEGIRNVVGVIALLIIALVIWANS